MKEYVLKVPEEEAGRRLDLFLLEFAVKNDLGLSRSFIQKLIRQANVTVKGLNALKPHYKVKEGDEINLAVPDVEKGTPQAEDIPLEVVYEDIYLAVINKPIGLVVHPAPGNYSHTLVNALLSRFKELSTINPERPGIVHRLDKETSGLLLVAKNNSAHLYLAEQFAKHTIKRKYIAVVKGKVELDEQVIELPIGRHPVKRKSMSVSFGANTKYAKTRYRTLKRADDYSLLELEPFTGRTHQLRVHLAFIGHAILGDSKYGKGDGFNRLMLHARSIGFEHPESKKLLEFSTEIPKEFLGLFIQRKAENIT